MRCRSRGFSAHRNMLFYFPISLRYNAYSFLAIKLGQSRTTGRLLTEQAPVGYVKFCRRSSPSNETGSRPGRAKINDRPLLLL